MTPCVCFVFRLFKPTWSRVLCAAWFLYITSRTMQHGFPSQPSALAYDPCLRLMAIGTKTGALKLCGAPGVVLSGKHQTATAVTQLHFVPGQGRLVSLLDDNSLHLWELAARGECTVLHESGGDFTLSARPGALPSGARATVACVLAGGTRLCVGTESGAVLMLRLPQLAPLEEGDVEGGGAVSTEVALHAVGVEQRPCRALGPVEALHQHPARPDLLLIGYGRGALLVWDLRRHAAQRHHLGAPLESATWQGTGDGIVSSHSDGSHSVWSPGEEQPQTSVTYGPFPCKAITKILWEDSSNGESLLVFGGGMPRASFGDRHCVTVRRGGGRHAAFDFTSRVVDFFTVHGDATAGGAGSGGDATALVVLVEEELVVLDLATDGWPTVPPPYLSPLHSSAITCSCHVAAVPLRLWERVSATGRAQRALAPSASWPILGGRNLLPEPSERNLLLTGHEDGTVRFWDASGAGLTPLYILSTAPLFQTDGEHSEGLGPASDDEWPPFVKVGCFDPYSDDPRLGIQKISLCKFSGRLLVAGTAGQVLIMELGDEAAVQEIAVVTVDLLKEREGFAWKGHERLVVRPGPRTLPAGYRPGLLLQVLPPAAVTALVLHAEWRLLAFGTSHGFGLFDYQKAHVVFARCTLHPSETLALEGPLSRVKSLKKSLRQSFRRIRKSRVSGKKRADPGSPATKVQEANARLAEQQQEEAAARDADVAPVQRRVEPRSLDDSLSGLVRCLYFADTFLRDGVRHGPTLWVGTNAGTVFAYSLDVPSPDRRSELAIHALLAKEIQLMHRAPVVSVWVLDGRGRPLPEPLEASHDLARAAEMQGGHSLLIASEEQFKVFSLPKVTAKTKFKLTAHEGARVRKVALCDAWGPPGPHGPHGAASGEAAGAAGGGGGGAAGQRDEWHGRSLLLCLTNLGDVHTVSVPGLRPLSRHACVRKEDISAVSSCLFTATAQGLYLQSPSEFQCFSVLASRSVEPRCRVEVAPYEKDCSPRPQAPGVVDNSPVTIPTMANGQRKERERADSLTEAQGVLEEIQQTLAESFLETSLGSMELTADITMEEVKDYLATADEAERNLRRIAEEDAAASATAVRGAC
ncbi:lethal(2) giant larvae protein homolog 1 isoform X1 [Petromyzon marinus]|uniref:lethal(2) giant larvae protein homolog 1 isoform X1 n=1 Tax=Petromyzon marinus TaxID=7757 RepID=UPI003F70C61D